MMVYRDALMHQARLEGLDAPSAAALVDSKFEMVRH